MLGSLPVLVFSSLVLCLLQAGRAEGKLRRVTVVYRHGDRSPTELFPTDPNKNAWPQGLGQLTQMGMRQHYELGQYLSNRYGNILLKTTYDPEEVYVRSTDIDRTLMSALVNLAGLYPPKGGQIWNPSILWQPIPVHTVPKSEDQLLGPAFEICPRYLQLIKETTKTEQYQKLITPYMKFLKTLSAVTNYTYEELVYNGKVWRLYDTLLCEEEHALLLPTWATPEARSKLKTLSQIIMLALYGIHHQEEKLRLQVGVLLDTILKNFTVAKADTSSSKQKMIIYSAHETTIAALHMALKVSNEPLPELPPYAACHLFELHEDNGDYSIDMYYRNSSSVGPHHLIMPGCGSPCSLEKFTSLVSPFTANDPMKTCGNTDNTKGLVIGLGVALAVVAIIAILLASYVVYLRRCHKEPGSAY